MTDEQLHNAVREKLNELKPVYQEKHWHSLETLLDNSHTTSFFFKHGWIIAISAVLMVSFTFYWYENQGLTSQISNDDNSFSKVESIIIENEENEVNLSQEKSETIAQKLHRDEITDNSKKIEIPPLKVPEETGILDYTSDLTYFQHKNRQVDYSIGSPIPIAIPSEAEVDLIVRLKNKPDSADRFISSIFERNKAKWKKSVVVCDWTSSIYRFAGDIVEWVEENGDNEPIQGFVFFTDCDSSGIPMRETQRPGAMFTTTKQEAEILRETMIQALRNSRNNKDWEENDMEAIVYAQKEFQEADEIVLIADNSNPVRDYKKLVHQIKKPVRIIVCGNTEDPSIAIQSHYWKLARITGGSIHLVDQDFYNVARLRNGTIIRVDKYLYEYQYNSFKLFENRRAYEEKSMTYPF